MDYKEFIFEIANLNDLDDICNLYKKVIKTTFTTWDENYPSKNLLIDDILNKNLYVLKHKKTIIAVSFLGTKEENKENWEIDLKRPMGVARICVDPNLQGKGVGSFFMECLINKSKKLGADGMHFHVEITNIAAQKMYQKCGFINCGLGQSNYGFSFYKFEQKF